MPKEQDHDHHSEKDGISKFFLSLGSILSSLHVFLQLEFHIQSKKERTYN